MLMSRRFAFYLRFLHAGKRYDYKSDLNRVFDRSSGLIFFKMKNGCNQILSFCPTRAIHHVKIFVTVGFLPYKNSYKTSRNTNQMNEDNEIVSIVKNNKAL